MELWPVENDFRSQVMNEHIKLAMNHLQVLLGKGLYKDDAKLAKLALKELLTARKFFDKKEAHP